MKNSSLWRGLLREKIEIGIVGPAESLIQYAKIGHDIINV